MPLFYETTAEREIDAMMQSERQAEREANRRNEHVDRATAIRQSCQNVQHILGGDCPICSPCEGCWQPQRYCECHTYLWSPLDTPEDDQYRPDR